MDISTTYLGMKLRSPLVASASPLMEHIDNIKRMEDAGVGAVVLYSLFEEQIRRESARRQGRSGRDPEGEHCRVAIRMALAGVDEIDRERQADSEERTPVAELEGHAAAARRRRQLELERGRKAGVGG